MEPLRVLDLFSGIGGLSLGLKWAGGFETIAFCEIDPFCRRVLAKHWPGIPIHEDVRALRGTDVEAVDVICGGFPCQDISVAGKGEGLAGERSGLWSEYARLIGEIRPRYVIVENVAALLGRGMGVILGDLASIRYDAEWRRISAFDAGAPHLRQRIWIVAYPSDRGQRLILQSIEECWSSDAPDAGRHGPLQPLAHSEQFGCEQVEQQISRRAGRERGAVAVEPSGIAPGRGWWAVEPDVGRVAHGVPARVDRLRGLGNAVVPQIPEAIGRAILAAEAA